MAHRLEIRLLNYILLITIAALMIGVEFYFELSQPDLREELIANIEHALQTNSPSLIDDQTFAPISKLRNKIVIMFGVLTIVVGIVSMMFIRNITTPLQKMVNVAQQINEGDLSQVIEIDSRDEIAQLGMTINDLTSNLQEIAAYTSHSSQDILRKLDSCIVKVKEGNPPDFEKMCAVHNDLEALIDVSNSFTLLKTDLNKFTESTEKS